MPGAPPEGLQVPADGSLPPGAAAARGRPFGIYVHVPFCATRCGYCDFNTYTATELGPGVSRDSYAGQAIAEVRFARRVLSRSADGQAPAVSPVSQVSSVPQVSTVFFGGGTPTLLRPEQLGAILAAIDAEFGLAPGAEVTAEANPESVDQASLARLREVGVTRLSLGMQSAAAHVLAVLERAHQPGRPQACVRWARAAGFGQISLDLIYGTPGETDEDWRRSLAAALAAEPDHISAYSLIVEDGTRLARRIARGELPAPDDDAAADRYLAADEQLAAAGLHWYEVSNWAKTDSSQCRHNLLYWTGADWWGIGPGAHSHISGTRWWNVRHPAAYAARIAAGSSPGQGREILTAAQRATEQVMLLTRLAAGCPVSELSQAGRTAAAAAVAGGLAQDAAHTAGRVVLTRQGRLLADAVIRDLTD